MSQAIRTVCKCRYEACGASFIGVAGTDAYCSTACQRKRFAMIKRVRSRKHNDVSAHYKGKLLELEAYVRETSDRARLALSTGKYTAAITLYNLAAKTVQDIVDMKAKAVLSKQQSKARKAAT